MACDDLNSKVVNPEGGSQQVYHSLDTVYDAVGYTESLIEGLVKEWQAQELGITTEYTELLDVKDALNTASHSIFKVRNWREPKRVYGPLTREDMSL